MKKILLPLAPIAIVLALFIFQPNEKEVNACPSSESMIIFAEDGSSYECGPCIGLSFSSIANGKCKQLTPPLLSSTPMSTLQEQCDAYLTDTDKAKGSTISPNKLSPDKKIAYSCTITTCICDAKCTKKPVIIVPTVTAPTKPPKTPTPAEPVPTVNTICEKIKKYINGKLVSGYDMTSNSCGFTDENGGFSCTNLEGEDGTYNAGSMECLVVCSLGSQPEIGTCPPVTANLFQAFWNFITHSR